MCERLCERVCERETVCVSVCWRSVGWDLGESSLTGTGSEKALSAGELACQTETDSQTENRLVAVSGCNHKPPKGEDNIFSVLFTILCNKRHYYTDPYPPIRLYFASV